MRAKITAGKLVPVGKETDRRWEQGRRPEHDGFSMFRFMAYLENW